MLRLKPPRKGKSPNYTIRGTYLGVSVDETTGTPVEAKARTILNARKREIERSAATPKVAAATKETTFAEAALAYILAGGEEQYLGTYNEEKGVWGKGLIPYFGETPLSEINQAAIDNAAAALYPAGSPMTRNRHVYTPISAVLKRAGVSAQIKRPKGWQGSKRTRWLTPDEAFRLFEAAYAVDYEFGIFVGTLCYTGCRLSEIINFRCNQIALAESFGYIPDTKNGEPRPLHLTPYVVAALANHPLGVDRGEQKVFRFRKNGHLYEMLAKAKAKAGVDWMSFHTLCHTWATWMRKYGKLDTRGLVGTKRWRDEKSAARYEHVVTPEEAKKADLLPTPRKARNVENTWKGKRLAAK